MKGDAFVGPQPENPRWSLDGQKVYFEWNPKSEPGSSLPAYVYMLKGSKSSDGIITFNPVVLDNDSGIGTQFAIADINGDGKLDIITSNKKGTFLLEQVKP